MLGIYIKKPPKKRSNDYSLMNIFQEFKINPEFDQILWKPYM